MDPRPHAPDPPGPGGQPREAAAEAGEVARVPLDLPAVVPRRAAEAVDRRGAARRHPAGGTPPAAAAAARASRCGAGGGGSGRSGPAPCRGGWRAAGRRAGGRTPRPGRTGRTGRTGRWHRSRRRPAGTRRAAEALGEAAGDPPLAHAHRRHRPALGHRAPGPGRVPLVAVGLLAGPAAPPRVPVAAVRRHRQRLAGLPSSRLTVTSTGDGAARRAGADRVHEPREALAWCACGGSSCSGPAAPRAGCAGPSCPGRRPSKSAGRAAPTTGAPGRSARQDACNAPTPPTARPPRRPPATAPTDVRAP